MPPNYTILLKNEAYQNLIEWIHREVEGYSRPEKLCEPIQHN